MLRASVIFVDTSAGDLSMVARASVLVSSGGSAVRRRERRLRGFWRHEQLSIKMALASATHHSWQSRASVGVGPEVDVPVSVGVRSEVLTEPRPHERLQRRTVEQLAVLAPPVQILAVPVPQMVDNVIDALRLLDLPIAEQVIEVPMISFSSRPSRSRVPEPQSAEQLVEVPTVLSPTRIALQIAEQIVDTPASARGVSGSLQGSLPVQSSAQRTASQIADIPAPGRGGSGCLLGSLPEQRTTALHVSQERISERIVEQIDAGGDFPFSSCRSSCRSPETGFSSCWCRAARRHCFFWRSSRFSPRTGFNGVSWTCSR